MPLDLYQVDAFTDRPFAGNPAAVCLLPEARDPRWLQDVAREMNLAETAFLYPAAPVPPGDAKPGFEAGDWQCAGSPPRSRWSSAAMPRWRAPTSSGRPDGWRRGRPPAFTP